MSNSLLIILLQSIVGVNAVNSFWRPPEKTDKILEYDMDQTLQILWETNFKNYSLVLQQVGTDSRQFIELNMTETKSWNWIVQTEIDLAHPFYFKMFDVYNGMNTFTCNHFRILPKNDTTTTTPSSTNPSASTGSLDSSSGTGTSTLAVGVGIGVGVGCAFFIALAAIIWYFRRRKATAAAAPNLNASNPPPAWSPPSNTQDPSKQMPPPAEVPGDCSC